MVKHIVLFKFKDENKEENIQTVKEMLEALLDSVPTLKEMEVGVNFSKKERAMDLSLISSFDDISGLEEYATHPEHIKVLEFIKKVTIETKVSDYYI
ncbi:MAG: Dabb family protein [Epsilonproteobacteria bacterium]|nr:Dabb family protein [Campylobacterota bacterium]